jgi:integrase/recombinase XerD
VTATPGERPYEWRIKPVRRRDALMTCAADFLEHEKAKSFSIRTVQVHDYHLARFIAFCEERGVTSVHDVTRPVVIRFQRYLFYYRSKNGRPLSASTQMMSLGAVRSFFRYLSRAGTIHANPAADLEMPKRGVRLPKNTFTIDEVERILRGVDLTNAMGIRDRAIIETLYSTGIRRAELCCLKVFDIDDERGVLTVRQGKGNKDRVVPIGERALLWVRRYVDEERPHYAMEPDPLWLFLTEEGEALSADWLSQAMRRHIDNAGIKKSGSCHIFRHTMATLMLEGGADIRHIQAILGHASLEATQIYTRVSIEHLKRVHTMAHPAKIERAPATSTKPTQSESARAELLADLDIERDEEHAGGD